MKRNIFITTFIMGLGFIVSCGGSGESGDNDNVGEAIPAPTPPPETTEPANNPPVITSFIADKTTGKVPLIVNFRWNVNDPDGDTLTCYLDADNNGIYEYTGLCNVSSYPSYTYKRAGIYKAVLKVSDGKYEVAESLTIKVESVASSSPSLATQIYYEINIVNPNTYSLNDYQIKIKLDVTKAVNGEQVFDFYDDFNLDNLNDYNVLEYNNGNAYVNNGFLYLSLPSSSLGDTVSIYFPLSQPITTGIVEARIYENLFNNTYGRQFSIGFSATNNVLLHWYTSTIPGDHFYNYFYFANSTKCTLETVYDSSQTIDLSKCGIPSGRRNYLLSFKMDGNQGISLYEDNLVDLKVSRISTVDQSRKNYAFISYHKYYLRPRSGAKMDWIRVRKYADQEPIVTINGNTITISNPNNYDLVDFQVKLPITQPIYDLIDNDKNSLPFCFEHSNGECDNKLEDIRAVWVKIPSIPANSSITLTIENQLFFDNFKILDPDGNPVLYCFEQLNGECNTNPTGVIWIKVPSIPANEDITLKVVEDSTNNAVNGDQIFDFYDDFFYDDFDNLLNWNYDPAYVNINNGIVSVRNALGCYNPLTSKTELSTPLVLESRLKYVSSNRNYNPGFDILLPDPNIHTNECGGLRGNWYLFSIFVSNTDFLIYWKHSGNAYTAESEADYTIDLSIFHTFKFVVSSNWVLKTYVDENLIATHKGYNFGKINGYIGWREGSVDIDWIRVRKYADQEPTYTIKKITQ